MVQEISCRQKATPTPMPTGSTQKTICPPPLRRGDIIHFILTFTQVLYTMFVLVHHLTGEQYTEYRQCRRQWTLHPVYANDLVLAHDIEKFQKLSYYEVQVCYCGRNKVIRNIQQVESDKSSLKIKMAF